MRNTATTKKSSLNDPTAIIIPAATTRLQLQKWGSSSNLRLGNGKTLLEDQIEKIGHVFTKPDFFYVMGKNPPNNFPANLRVIQNQDWQNTGVAKSIGLATLANLHKAVLIVYGDLFFGEDSLRILEQTGKDRYSSILTTVNKNKEDVGIYAVGGIVQNLYYGLSRKWCQIAYLTGQELELFKEISNRPTFKGRLTFEVFNDIIQAGGTFHEVATESEIWDIDKTEDVKKLKLII